MPMTPHPSHRIGFVDLERRCVVCFAEPDWPLIEQRCSSLGRDGREIECANPKAPRRTRARRHVPTDDILKLLKLGESIAEVMRTLRVDYPRVKKIADLYKIPVRAQGKREL